MNLKQSLKGLAGSLWQHSPSGRQRLRQTGAVLMLHRVLPHDRDAELPHRAPLCIGQPSFERLLRWLKRYFDCVPLEQLLEHPPGHRPRVALSFDDGWRDNAEVAYPLLERYEMPASIFLSTDFIGSRRSFWWEAIGETLWLQPESTWGRQLQAQLRSCGMTLTPGLRQAGHSPARSHELGVFLQHLKSLSASALQSLADSCPNTGLPHSLDWGQVRRMERSGLVRFGPHGASHGILTQFSPAQLASDLGRSHATLQKQCAAPLPIYCYPNGDHNHQVRSAVMRLGYRHGLSTAPGLIDGKSPALALPRIDVGQHAAHHPSLMAWRLYQGARA